MREKNIEKQILTWLQAQGFWAQKIQSGAVAKNYTTTTGAKRTHWIHLAEKGTPDIVACAKGRFIAIEVKKDAKAVQEWKDASDAKKMTILCQRKHAALIVANKGVSMIVCSLDEVKKDFKSLKMIL